MASTRLTVFKLGKMAALVSALQSRGPDPEARVLAGEIVSFFSTTARAHHEDEERHVFPKVLASGNPEQVQAVRKLQQDHGWLEEDWLELSPHFAAVADGQSWYDLDVLREGVEVFIALSHEHMALEESLVYPEARAQSRLAERGEMGREMAARRRAKN